jgi:type I restriction enzyme S subunit
MNSEIPSNWTCIDLKELVFSRKGKKPKRLSANHKGGYIPYILIDEMEGKPARSFTNDKSMPTASEKDILVVWDGSIGKTAKGLTGAIGSTIAALTPIIIETTYLESFIKLSKPYIEQTSRGIGLQHINPDYFWTLQVPLAPLNEQRRIVVKLEKLLRKVDTCKERLDKIPSILKRFRQSVLAAACSGRLTVDWRGKNKIDLEEWSKAKMGEIADMRLGKMLDKAKNLGKPTRYLRNLNVRWFSFELTDLSLMRATIEEKGELAIKDGDLLVCEGGEPGRCAVWNLGKTDLIFQKAIHRIRPSEKLSSKWIAFNMKNDADSGHLNDYFTGTTIKHLTGKSLAKYEISLPSLPEQHEIVRRVEALFKKADEIEARYKKAKAFVDKITPSILAKAFRGELVPQDPKDEPASVLLERIREERTKRETEMKAKKKTNRHIKKPLSRKQ